MARFEASPNRAAPDNIRWGEQVFRKGLRTAEDVFRAHLTWNRGAAAEHHFANGYYEAAKAANMKDVCGEALRFVDPLRFGGNYEKNKALARAIWAQWTAAR